MSRAALSSRPRRTCLFSVSPVTAWKIRWKWKGEKQPTSDNRLSESSPGARRIREELFLTPGQTEGPSYPDKLPLDTDNDLLVINDAITPAVGDVTWLSGRILDSSGGPVSNATVEIWQCDSNGAYLRSKTGNAAKRDVNFQGFGRFVTGSAGERTKNSVLVPFVPLPGSRIGELSAKFDIVLGITPAA
ncbi:MAG: hypothetical protein HY235_16630 [Acidobacteria bacterium]|nr:hypothetical protein [Acidobacteriota bacterium]